MEIKNDKLKWLEFDLLKPYQHVVHGVFSRHGGASKGPYTSLNVSTEVGDHPDSVKFNRLEIDTAISSGRIVFPHQMHDGAVVRITGANWMKTHHADALLTTEKNIALTVMHADCQAALFYDPVHEAIAVAHVGWRGSVQNVYAKLIDQLKSAVGTMPKDLFVCISPSLGPCHAEFKNYKEELPEEFWPFQVKPHYFDFWKISRMQLTQAGVTDRHIEIAGICTYCHGEDYYSHRRDAKTGRNATVIVLK